ncbi:polysaccharide pyruvyl transferase family protein [Chloroflexota bacterium]
MASKITIHGFYGEGNLGDEAILKALLQEFSKFTHIKVVVFSRNPKRVSIVHGVKSVHSQGRRSLLRRIWEIKTSDLFILGGGGLLKDYGNDSKSIKRWLGLLRLTQRLKVKTALYAVGIENIQYNSSKELLREALDKVKLITVRDDSSRDILRDIGVMGEVKVTTDPALLFTDTNVREIEDASALSKSPRIMICVRHWFDKGFYIEKPEANEHFLRSLGIAADFIVERYQGNIDFIPMRVTSYDDDRAAAEQVISYMTHKSSTQIYPLVPDADEFIKMVRQYSLVVGMRLHSLILATVAGVPVIGLEYMPKVKAYMKSINQDEYSLALDSITSDKLISLIEKTFDKRSIRSKIILSEVCRLQRIAQDNIAELVELAGGK